MPGRDNSGGFNIEAMANWAGLLRAMELNGLIDIPHWVGLDYAVSSRFEVQIPAPSPPVRAPRPKAAPPVLVSHDESHHEDGPAEEGIVEPEPSPEPPADFNSLD